MPALFAWPGCCARGRDVNIFVQIGLVVLVGLACKNAILIVEYAKQKHQEGWSRDEATREACRLRLRPILMTSFAFIIGVIPLAVASGAGAEMRRSLGIAVFSGMLGVTLFGIFLTPVFFYVIQGLERDAAVHDRRPRDGSARPLLGGLAGWGSAICARASSASSALSWAAGGRRLPRACSSAAGGPGRVIAKHPASDPGCRRHGSPHADSPETLR